MHRIYRVRLAKANCSKSRLQVSSSFLNESLECASDRPAVPTNLTPEEPSCARAPIVQRERERAIPIKYVYTYLKSKHDFYFKFLFLFLFFFRFSINIAYVYSDFELLMRARLVGILRISLVFVRFTVRL